MKRHIPALAFTTAIALALAALEVASPGFLLLAWEVIVEVVRKSAVALAWPFALLGAGWLGYQLGHLTGHRDAMQQVSRATAGHVVPIHPSRRETGR